MITDRKLNILLALLISTSSLFCMKREAVGNASNDHLISTPLPMNEAKRLYANNSEELKACKEALIEFYEKVDAETDMTGYETVIASICKEHLSYFYDNAPTTQNNTKKRAVIFDVDDTCLSNYLFRKECDFSLQRGDAYNFRSEKKCTVILPMLKFCKILSTLGYNIIFISSRRDSLTQATRENLEEAGYGVNGIFLMPQKTWEVAKSNHALYGEWKEGIRKKLYEVYDIIGCVGDNKNDYFGDFTGHIVALPSFLY